MSIPEFLRDRYEEERSARAEANPDSDYGDSYSEDPAQCEQEECTYPDCDCMLENEDD